LAVGFYQAAVIALYFPRFSLPFVSLGIFYREWVEVLVGLCMSDSFWTCYRTEKRPGSPGWCLGV